MGCRLTIALLALAVVASAQGYPDSVIAQIPVGGDPTDVSVLPNGTHAYVANQTAQYVTVVDIENRQVVGHVTCGNNPYMAVATPDGRYVYVTSESDDAVSVIRTSDNTVVDTIPVGNNPHRLCISPDGSRCYTANENDNSVSVIRTSDNTVIATVPVGPTPRDVDCDNQYIYTANLHATTLTKIRASDNTVVATINLGFAAHRVRIMPGGEYAYATQYEGTQIGVVRTSDDTLIATINAGAGIAGMCFVDSGKYMFVASAYNGGSALVVRTSDNVIVDRIRTGTTPLAVNHPANESYVASADRGGQSVTVIGYRYQHDVCPVRILAPVGAVDSGMVMQPMVLVRNQGTTTDMFPVTMQIGSGYTATVQDTLPAGSSDTVRFPVWTAGPVGTSPVVCFTELVGDENPANDTITDSILVNRVAITDAGTSAILAPSGTVDSGTVVTPAAVVRNFGTAGAVFPVTMTIDGFYTQNATESLPAGATDTVSFPPWTAGSPGTFAVICHTTLAGDENPANDTARGSVEVRRQPVVDAGVQSILSPHGSVDSGSSCMPIAVIRNYGLTDAVFPVTMLIGTGYSQVISETLPANSSDTVSFPGWDALQVDAFSVVCFTSLVGDEEPANDTVRDSVRVVGPAVHDVGAVAILVPAGAVRAGDTVIPKARIKNFGNVVERFFDVRFRIGTGYGRTVNVTDALLPDSAAELTFAPWVAASSTWAVSCSTMLVSDGNRANDKVSSSVLVFSQSLHIEPDQSDRLEAGQGKTYKFHALIEGDTGGVVEVARPSPPPGWSLRLGDATGVNDLTDTDGDGMPDLGYVPPGESGWFSLEVTAPSELQGDTAALSHVTFLLAGHVGDRPDIADTAVLNLTLVPTFSIHNFPNPFSNSTSFVIGLPEDGEATLTVYTRAGERVCRVLANADLPAGVHLLPWAGVNDNGRAIAPGTYEYLLDYVHGDKTDRIRKKLVLTRQ
jgi:YVTN family beta-propeller protein